MCNVNGADVKYTLSVIWRPVQVIHEVWYTEIMNRTLLTGLAGLALTVGTGCGRLQHGMHYDLLLDPSLTADQMQDTMAAGDGWAYSVPGLTFTYTVVACEGYPSDAHHTVCIHADSTAPTDSDGNHIDATTSWQHGLLASDDSPSADSADIIIHSVNIANGGQPLPNAFFNVIRHEMGHAMTHNHLHIAMGNLMQPAITAAQAPELITDNDIAYFWAAR